MTVRSRFAPSPTGDLHIGGVRTALYAWLYARKHNGTFILRIEDTDVERSTEASTQRILEGLQWLSLEADEGPFFQSKRYDRYREVLDQLLAAGQAYYCYCSKERLEQIRETQIANKQKPRYDGHCRHLELKKASHAVIRFKNPLEGEVVFHDQVFGEIRFQNAELDDLILARSDGHPTYNFTVVVDDWDMKITHVIRGDDHINNTPRQLNILQALGAQLPVYAHVPMILGADGKRLSKRHGALSVLEYREAGYLPEALLNALVRLGWSHGDQEIFSRTEMCELFDLPHIHRAAAAFNPEKLQWLNQHYLKTLPAEKIIPHLEPLMKQHGLSVNNGPALSELLPVQAERCKTLVEIIEKSRYFYEPIQLNPELVAKHITAEVLPALQALHQKLKALSNWNKEALHTAVAEIADQFNLKLGKLGPAIRVVVTGDTVSPSIDVTLKLLGKEAVLTRLDALSRLESPPFCEK